MTTTQTLINILTKIETPTPLITNYLNNNATRLFYLLWGKTDTYEGPLYDGLQINEWSVVILLVSNWSLEVYALIMKDKKILKEEVDLFFAEANLLRFGGTLVKEIIKAGLITGSRAEEILLIENLMKIPAIYDFLVNELSKVKTKISALLTSCTCCTSSNLNKIKTQVETLSEMTGVMSTTINKVTNL